MIDKLSFLNEQQVHGIAQKYGTPIYVYSEKVLQALAEQALAFGSPYGFAVRYAIKANPHPEILGLFNKLGLVFDASSGEEAEHILAQGIIGNKIALNSQQLPSNLSKLIEQNMFFTATSLHQIEKVGRQFPGINIGIRINPGLGSGASNKVTTAGVSAGFGIWHEQIPQINKIADKYKLNITKLHTHIGAGTDPLVWHKSAKITLGLVKQFKNISTISLGGGFKVARMQNEKTADIKLIGKKISSLISNYYKEYKVKLKLEIEPGTYLSANAGVLIAEIIDITNTGKNGFTFLRLNTGMNDILRISLYGAQHPLVVVNKYGRPCLDTKKYVVIGHNCESGDLLTPLKGDPESIEPRQLGCADIGDYLVIEGAGAYCASMRAIGYNSFTPATELYV